MFNALVGLLFPAQKKENESSFFYFEETKSSTEDISEKMIDELQSSLQAKSLNIVTKEEMHQKAFYDFLFGQSPPTEKHDDLSIHISGKISQLLAQPNAILKALPVLPASLSKLLEQLNNKQFNTEVLMD